MLAGDYTISIEAFRKPLDPYYDVVATAANGRLLLEVAPQVNPDVIVVDVGMPAANKTDLRSDCV